MALGDTISLAGVGVLIVAHLVSGRLRFLRFVPRSRLLSAAGGVAVAFVFVQLLPLVARDQHAFAGRSGLAGPLATKALFLVALGGLIAYYGVDRALRPGVDLSKPVSHAFWLQVGSAALMDATIGYLFATGTRPGLRLAAFTLAMALKVIVTDRGMFERYGRNFDLRARPLLLAAVPAGWAVGYFSALPPTSVAVARAVLAGGVVLRVLQEELPAEREASFVAFALGASGYAGLLLAV